MLVYQDNYIELYHGDNLSVLLTLAENSIDAVITDPPFGINYQNNYTQSKHKKLTGDTEKFSYYPWSSACWPLLKDDSAIFAYTGWSEYPDHVFHLRNVGYQLKEPLIVQKRPSGKTDLFGTFQSNADWLLFAHKGKFKFKRTEILKNKHAGTNPGKGRKPVPEFKFRFPACWFGPEYPQSTEHPKKIEQWRHPTIKTVELMEWLILLSTNENNVVLDPFAGAGTTLIAAKQLRRKAIGIELDKDFIDIIIQRLKLCE